MNRPDLRRELLDFINTTREVINEQAQCLDNIRRIHTPEEIAGQQLCRECLKPWPCPTCKATIQPDRKTT